MPALYILVSLEVMGMFLQAFIFSKLRAQQLLLQRCLYTYFLESEGKCQQLLAVNAVPVCLVFLCFFRFLFPPPSLLLSSFACLPVPPPGAAQLYQQYNEAAQNFEILRQARSETLSVCEDTTSSPLPSPPTIHKHFPPVPPQPYFHSISHTGSIQNLPLPERPKGERRASSPRLSISQSSSLWRDLPGVRDNAELEQFTDDQRRLQEVTVSYLTYETCVSCIFL